MTTADILGGNVSDEVLEAAVLAARKSGKPMRMDKTIEEEEKRQAEMKARQTAAEARKANLVAKAIYKTQVIDPFDILKIKPITKERGWDKGKQFSEGQRKFLQNLGFYPDKITYAQGKQIMDAAGKRRENHLSTLNQITTLKKFKIDAADYTFQQASATIDAIAKNGWQKPANLPPLVPALPKEVKQELQSEDVPF